MKFIHKAIIIGLIGMLSLASMASADRASLANNDWDGMTRTSWYAGDRLAIDDLLNPSKLRNPSGVLALPDGTVLVADTANQVIKKVIGGEVELFSGVNILRDEWNLPIGTLLDGVADSSNYHLPTGLAHDADGYIYVADAGNHAIRKIAPDGSVTTIAGNGVLGLADGAGSEARFNYPTDVAVADDGTIYVADTLNHVIRKIDKNGRVTTLNSPSTRVVEVFPGVVEPAGDYRDGHLADALFNEPAGLALDEQGNLYVSDSGNGRIRYIDLKNQTVTTVAGGVYADAARGVLYKEDALYVEGFYKDGPALEALFYSPKGIALTAEGGLLIADSENHAVRYLKNGQVTTVAGTPEEHGYADGIEGNNLLYRPFDVAVTADGSLLIADSYNHVIRQVKLYELPASVQSASHIQVVYEDQLIRFDAQPEAVSGRTMVPVRFISEALGFEVEYAADEQKISLVSEDRTIEFVLGHTEIRLLNSDGSEIRQSIDAAPYAKNNRTYLPVRFFAEIIGLDVTWIQDQQLVILRDRS
jgi:sugar lactone lactonase YvrE